MSGSETADLGRSEDAHPGRWGALALLSLAELLGMSPWLLAGAVSTQWVPLWGLGPGELGWLTTLVQLGFVAGTAAAAFFNLADIWPARIYFAGCALLVALSNAALLLAPTYPAALATRFASGFFMAGVYPPAMKMVATWFRSGRGLAIGAVVGGLVVGKAAPYLFHGVEGLGWRGAPGVLRRGARRVASRGDPISQGRRPRGVWRAGRSRRPRPPGAPWPFRRWRT